MGKSPQKHTLSELPSERVLPLKQLVRCILVSKCEDCVNFWYSTFGNGAKYDVTEADTQGDRLNACLTRP